MIERRLLKHANAKIAYHESLTARIQAEEYIKILGPLLDYSSILHPQSYLIKSFINKYQSLSSKVDWLATVTKNQPFLMKEEGEEKLIKVHYRQT